MWLLHNGGYSQWEEVVKRFPPGVSFEVVELQTNQTHSLLISLVALSLLSIPGREKNLRMLY